MIFRAKYLLPQIACAWMLCGALGWGQAPTDPPPAKTPPAGHKFVPTSDCRSCHENELKKVGSHSDFLGVVTAKEWVENDKHYRAFSLLKDNPKLVTRILGFDLLEAFTNETYKTLRTTGDEAALAKVAVVRQCLNCHATWPSDHDAQPEGAPLEFGVSCQACHGAAEDWLDAHRREWWRLVKPEQKSLLGFTDVRDPATRVRLCASCHVGDYSQGKFVRHEWYAGGHPPLPSFEYSTFASAMPVHWETLQAKGNFRGRDATSEPVKSPDLSLETFQTKYDIPAGMMAANYREANFPNLRPDQNPFQDQARFKDSVFSSAVVLEQYAKIAKDYATVWNDKTISPRPVWPEFSLYDCASCHHELKSGQGFPQRPFGNSPPGRPPAHLWPMALAELGELHVAQYDRAKAQASLDALESARVAFSRSLTGVATDGTRGPVFGYPTAIASSAGALELRMTDLIERLKSAPFDKQVTAAAIVHLTNADRSKYLDYHSARQIAWAVREVSKDYKGDSYWPEMPPTPTESLIDQLFGGAQSGTIRLKLPATQADSIIQKLPENLKAISEFDAQLYDAQLKIIPGKLGIEKTP